MLSYSGVPLEEMDYFHHLLNDNSHFLIPLTNYAKDLVEIQVMNLCFPMSVNCSCNVNWKMLHLIFKFKPIGSNTVKHLTWEFFC